MPSDIIKFRNTKEFQQSLEAAEELITTDNQSDLIRTLVHLGVERLKEAFNAIESVTHTLKRSETAMIASSIKIHLLKAKEEQLKELKR